MTVVLHYRPGPAGAELHGFFEALAYFIGFRIYLSLRKKFGDSISGDQRWWVITAAAFGAVLGSRLLSILENLPHRAPGWTLTSYISSGKTIVGALVGGWLAVEWVKRRVGIGVSTGDLLAIPLALGIAIGRVGCFLAGLPDQTYGVATTLPWGVDFGDGIPRHPTQLYEIAFLLVFCTVLWNFWRSPHRNGDVFRLFMIGYMTWRFTIDFWKPDFRLASLSMIQWTCLFVLAYYSSHLVRIVRGVEHFAPAGSTVEKT